ncbi:hypothetical protein EYF80_054065 [Liparis tanakae]|uniref:Uncharacterized protein n=1 Tax=Liparis tanakae TaxID=230148 RepID=A0A4Z2F3S9_9TELE|nr:hypothetical protein EYF80_054065 [Liparis tanakae]
MPAGFCPLETQQGCASGDEFKFIEKDDMREDTHDTRRRARVRNPQTKALETPEDRRLQTAALCESERPALAWVSSYVYAHRLLCSATEITT